MQKISHITIRKRLLATTLLITFLFAGLVTRLFFVQIVDGQQLQIRAFDQWTRDLPMRADRGDIVDCNGVLLAQSDTVYTLYARPAEITEKEQTAQIVAGIVGTDYDSVYRKVTKKGVSEVTIAKNLPRDTMLKLIATDIKGMYLSADSTRHYPLGNFLTQVIGFTNSDGVGQSGVEAYYNDYLKGINGAIYTQTDIIGNKLPDRVCEYLLPVKGMTTQLTIDAQMQSFAQKATQDALLKYRPKSASCIIMSAKTGEIKALAGAPTFDLNELPRDDIDLLLQGSRNGIVSDAYEPGSTFKILTSAIGIEQGKIKNSYYCNGAATVDGQRIKCWRSIGHGSQSFEKGIQNSCNCVFMDIALSVGTDTMYDYFGKFGLGGKTGVDISGEAKGILLAQDRVKNVDLARIGFGQTIAVTPIQLASAVASVVNGGTLYEPHIVKQITDGSGQTAYRALPVVRSRPIGAHTSDLMKDYLVGVVSEGSGKNAYVPGYKIGGKTGTAQKYENGAIASGKYISSFVGFADVGDDTLVCLMLVDEPQGYAYYGSIVAAPYVGEIFQNIFMYRNVAPEYTGDEIEQNQTLTMPDLYGMSIGEASAALKALGIEYEFVGESGRVTDQIPAAGSQIKRKSVAFFRTE